jgi:Zn/Cd-binding protein ZinT
VDIVKKNRYEEAKKVKFGFQLRKAGTGHEKRVQLSDSSEHSVRKGHFRLLIQLISLAGRVSTGVEGEPSRR